MQRLLWVPVFLALAGCPPVVDTGVDGGGVIVVGPEGGKFIREGVYIDIPRGAVGSETSITVEVVDDDVITRPVTGRKRISYGYVFRPTALVFKEPVTIGARWLEDRIPAAGIDPATFDMRRATKDDPFTQLPSPDSLPTEQVVTARSDRLGAFWITSPLKPAVSEISLTPDQATLRVGETVAFTAKVTDPAGNELPEVQIKWSIVAPRVASVKDGLVEALAPGIATLTAQAGDVVKTATISVVGTTVGPQTFLHENPFPTGNDLHGGALSGGTAFFVGANGTVLARSQDGWSRLYSTPAVTLTGIGGSFPAGAVAVGTSGNSGVLVELKDPAMAPTVQIFPSALPRALAFDGTHGMAVGSGNDVIVRRNGAWEVVYSPSFETLTDVKGNGAGGFVTVGNRGSIYLFDPVTGTWDSLYDTQLNVLLVDGVLTDATGTEGWAIGANKLWHFEAAGWTAINLPASPVLDGLTAIGVLGGNVVVAGRQQNQPYLLVFAPDGMGGGAWTSQALRPGQLIRDIFGSGAEGYAVGDFGSVWQYGMGTFTEVSRGFYGDVADVFATSAVQVAAVNECATADCTARSGKVMLRSATGAWEELGFQPFTGPLFSVAAKGPTDVFAGGEGVVWHYDGMSWTPQFFSGAPINGMAVCGNDVWAVGAGGGVYKGAGATLTAQNALGGNDLYAVHCQSASEVWIAGDQALFRNRTAVNDMDVTHALYRAVWTPAGNEVYGFGEDSFGTYWDTANLNVINQPGGTHPEVVTGLWGSSVDNLYAVAWTVNPLTFGYGLRFNGAQWSLVDTGAQRNPTSIHGYSATDIFIGTEGGGILKGVAPP